MNGVPVWLELKIVKNNRVSLSKSQIAWHSSHFRCKGVSFFLLHCPSTSDLFLFGADKAIELLGSRIDDLRPAACGLALWIYEIKNPLPTLSARDQGKPD